MTVSVTTEPGTTSPPTPDPGTDQGPHEQIDANPYTLREYQVEAADAVQDQWREGYERTSVILPTGSGKSTVIAEVANREVAEGRRVLLLAHRGELLGQMAGAVAKVNPKSDPVGIVMAERNDNDSPIVAASFQTLAKSPERIEQIQSHGRIGVVLVDEAHHATAESYLGVLAQLGLSMDSLVKKKKSSGDTDPAGGDEDERQFGDHPEGASAKGRKRLSEIIVKHGGRPGVVACGFTATMSRADSSRLGEVWNTVAYEKDLIWAIENGYLIEPVGKTVQIKGLDKLKDIKTVAGDFNQSQLDEVMRASTDTTVDAIAHHARDRASIVFAASVEHASILAEALSLVGIRAEAVVGADSRSVRESVYERFRSGETQALVTVMVLTEGADFPRCDCVVMARPTRSNVLFSQMVGRALRLYTDPETGEEKDNALVLDLTGSARDKKLVTLTDLWGDATTQLFSQDGEEITPPPPPEPAPQGPGRERRGKAEFENVDLLKQKKKPWDNVHVISSRNGLVFVPSGVGSAGTMLWPPFPERAEKVYLVQVDPRKGLLPFVDGSGRPVAGSMEQALAGAKELAYKTRNPDGTRACMRAVDRWAHMRPSDKQKALAERVGAPVTSSMSKGEVSDAITGVLVEKSVNKFAHQLPQMGLSW